MNKDQIKEITYIVIAIVLGIFAVKFIIWLLPIILIAVFSYYIYNSIKKKRQPEKTSKNKTKKKTIKIIDMEDNDK